MTESLVLYNHSIREILILYIILLSVNCFVSLRKKRGPEMLRTWKVDGFNILLYLGCHSRRTEATVRHTDIPSCQIWKIANRTVTHLRISSFPLRRSCHFSGLHVYPRFCCSCLSICWLVFAISQNPKEARKGLESQWYIGISYMGDQRSGMGLGTQKQKFK